jgi:DNA replication and repair protein RecF
VSALRQTTGAVTALASQTPAAAAGAAPHVAVTRLTLTDFRCYASLRLDVDSRPVVLTGANGAGKTNLLEAVSFLAPGRGLRGVRLAQVGRQQARQNISRDVSWAVATTLATPDGPLDLGTGLIAENTTPASARATARTIHINGQPAKGAAALARHLGVLWLTPAMDRLFVDGPTSRRKFLDRLVVAFDADHAGRIAAYDHAYRQRSRLLKEAGGDAAWFAALEDTMARHGIALAAARHDVVARLNRDLAANAGPFPAASLALVGTVDAWLSEMPAVDAEDAVRRSLWDERRGILNAGAGPHKSDLGVAMSAPGHASHGQPAALCSTGEQKALLISILLSQARLQRAKRGHAPVLLLDEIAAHLDEHRRRALFDEVLRLGAQAWMTGTDAALFRSLGDSAQFHTVENATCTRRSLVTPA